MTNGVGSTRARERTVIWWAVGAIAVVAALAFAWMGWDRHQQLAAAEASVAAHMELDGATRVSEERHYVPPEAPSSDSPNLTIGYDVSDDAAMRTDLENQRRADGWEPVEGFEGVWLRGGQEPRSLTVSVEGDQLFITIGSIEG